ncbi:unnamed protein product [Mycena citricolor]|uniref:Cytochrome b561 domain-containing protein n=1 Tax=Mycena citricolor TaxID=2018698 RepID=A0AAD2K6A9_9AGAR|nr:unnamed protein product [Mycena citricolor]CAK5281168.1 unnamed protein product [Mycena citricolor]
MFLSSHFLAILPALCTVATGVSAALSPSNRMTARDNTTTAGLTGDSACTTNMCISAVLNGSTTQYTLASTGKQSVGWMAIGFGTVMAGSPMVIMWPNSNGSVTISQRSAPTEQMPTLVANPARVATLDTALSTTSGNPQFVFTIPSDSSTAQNLIFGFCDTNPGTADPSATLQMHIENGNLNLDLSKALNSSSGSSTSSSSTQTSGSSMLSSTQRMIIAHAIVSVIAFALLLPSGVLLARYLRTFTPTWYTGHWIAQLGLAGPAVIVGISLGFAAAGPIRSKILDQHKVFSRCPIITAADNIRDLQTTGIVLLVLYLFQVALGAVIHFVKPKNSTRRPIQNYFHALLGLTIIGLGLYQIHDGYSRQWTYYSGLGLVASGVNKLWIVWSTLIPVLYVLGLLLFLRKQYRQEAAARTEKSQIDSEH